MLQTCVDGCSGLFKVQGPMQATNQAPISSEQQQQQVQQQAAATGAGAAAAAGVAGLHHEAGDSRSHGRQAAARMPLRCVDTGLAMCVLATADGCRLNARLNIAAVVQQWWVLQQLVAGCQRCCILGAAK
jgi:hypothetical protein